MGVWPITSDDLQTYIGPVGDPVRLDEAALAAVAYAEDRRSDLTADWFSQGKAPDDVRLGAIRYGTILYNVRSSPTGYAAFGDGAIDISGEPGYPAAMRLLGWKRPVVA